jgi:hypothetical protein
MRKPNKNPQKPSGNREIFARLANEFPQWRMTMTEREQDLENLKAEVQRLKLDCYDYCAYILDLDESLLAVHGHKSKESALLFSVSRTERKIKNLTQEHVKKYPD